MTSIKKKVFPCNIVKKKKEGIWLCDKLDNLLTVFKRNSVRSTVLLTHSHDILLPHRGGPGFEKEKLGCDHGHVHIGKRIDDNRPIA